MPGTLQVKLADHPAIVTSLGNQFGNQRGRLRRERFVPVAAVMQPAGIQSGHVTGPARRANRALTVRMSKRGPFGHQPVQSRRADIRIPESRDRVKPLLIGAVPEDVRTVGHVES